MGAYLSSRDLIFLRYEKEIPWSQSRVSLWHSYGQWDALGNGWGFSKRYNFPEKRDTGGECCPLPAFISRLWSGIREDRMLSPAANTWDCGNAGKPRIPEMLSWSGAQISLICWIDSREDLHLESLFTHYCSRTDSWRSCSEETRLLLQKVLSLRTCSVCPWSSG